ncbi:uncharacterized protein HMPREF1541_10987 [Cyphellophora europaea CBS 101466]|uniref:amidase n=1 Tax=Cyphellophora europaea (strain CBS 101466) TaxID=1220924 RepID=W2S595_CYPE1|nr:uncharacterized protein HMPREF1541_10987 [Cyphellophora europaea CBS 101466]ETN43856.1 hypothetical protein HMPREF1541_10987 [Cyphellophora europaea CBS 101466]
MPPPFAVENWKAEAAKARMKVEQSIPSAWRLPASLAALAVRGTLKPEDPRVISCGILEPRDIELTSISDVSILLQALSNRRCTAVEVATAFCKRAAIAHQCTSCLTCFFPEEALKRAGELDDYLATEGKVVGALHGLPVSLKDSFNMAGKVSSIGLVSWLPNIASENSECSDAILAAGGVLFVKTGTSQACLMVESINNIFGSIRNPYNPDLSVGGSSGGEGALLASKGSILGLGTDGGGSLRFPAMFCGLWALKCSKGRVPAKGLASTYDGNESTNAGLGPLSRSVSGLEVGIRALLATRPWERDPGCIPMAWKSQEAIRATGKLRIAVLRDDGVVEPVASVVRAIQMVIKALERVGHEVVDLPAERMKTLHRRGTSCVMKSNVQNGGRSITKHIQASGEPVVPRTAVGSKDSLLTSEEIFANHVERSKISREYSDVWLSYRMDAILSPAVAHPACPHGEYISNAYAGIYNMLDYVTGSIPVTTVRDDDAPNQAWLERDPYPQIEAVRFPYDKGDKEMKDLYTSPAVFRDAPVGVQIVCQRLREEKCVGIMKEIEVLLAEPSIAHDNEHL